MGPTARASGAPGEEPDAAPSPLDVDLEALAATGRQGCPFCPERVMEVTPRFRPEIHAEGRISHGEALLFPNLLSYWQHTARSRCIRPTSTSCPSIA